MLNQQLTSLRIDLWLWTARLFKTRSQAALACTKGKIFINNLPAKPSKIIKINDTISINFGAWKKTIIILEISNKRLAPKNISGYFYDITPADEYQKQKDFNNIRHQNNFTFPGRPTKRNRRNYNNFIDDF